jgi:hypoxanthine phosphoribosyltransferase
MRLSDHPLVSADEIARRVDELAEAISRDYEGRDILVMPVLKGGVFFAADLMRRLTVPVRVDFIRARSYQGTRSGGTVEFLLPPSEPVAGRHVLVVEDILDTGRTTSAVLDRLQADGPASLALCVFLDKPSRRAVNIKADYVGLVIPDEYVVGYGLDHDERYRQLPAIYVLKDP